MLKKNFIQINLKKYYCQILKNDLMFFKFLNPDNKKNILLFFSDEIISLNVYISKLKKIIYSSIENLDNNSIYYYINLINTTQIFIYSNKLTYNIKYNLKEENIQTNILKKFFSNYIINIILDVFIHYQKNNTFFNKNFNYDKKLNINGIENNIKYLDNIITNYFKYFIDFYLYLLNKKDENIKYIFPIYLKDDNNFLLSVVNLNQLKGGVNETATETDLDHIKNILIDMENNNNSIKNFYTKDEIKKLENVLENKKINKLINNNEIKLSKDYKNLVENAIKPDINNPDKISKYESSKNFFNKLFVVNNDDKNKIDNLYEIYKDEPNKKQFIDYMADKIFYNNYLKKSNEFSSDNSLKKTNDMLVVFDKVFEQILNSNLEHNSLHLTNDDTKFILMLEVLHTLKENVKQPIQGKNLTLNIYKEISGLNVNDDKINLN